MEKKIAKRNWQRNHRQSVIGTPMKFELAPNNRNVPDAELLADLKRVASELGKTAVAGDEYNERGRFNRTTLIDRFGSWNKALEQAGLARTKNQNISDEELFKNLAEIWVKIGRQPFIGDLTSKTSKYSDTTYRRRFGSWRKALEAFVGWANEGEMQAIEALPGTTKPSTKQEVFRHKTSRTINYRLQFLVMRRDNFRCKITGRSPATDPNVILEVDHIVPWDKGGETVMENLQTLVKQINIGKSNLDMYQKG